MSVSTKKNNAVEWKGTLPNLPTVAVDTFKPKANVFFLSHAHSGIFIL
jgi:hypothetical protein